MELVGWFVGWLVGYMVCTEANNVIVGMELFVPAWLVNAWPWKWCSTLLRNVGKYSPRDRAWHPIRRESSVFVLTRFRLAVMWWRNECRKHRPLLKMFQTDRPVALGAHTWRHNRAADTSLLLTITSALLTSNTWFVMHCFIVWIVLINYELRSPILHL
jgi:hypothetical protein